MELVFAERTLSSPARLGQTKGLREGFLGAGDL
jgi:hypothetical protein